MTRQMILSNDESVSFYTGVLCKDTLITIFKIIKGRVTQINYWRGAIFTNENKLCAGLGGRTKIIDHFDEYLLTLVYIQQELTARILSDLFGVSTSTVTRIIHTWINVLYQLMRNWLIWPSAQQVRSTVPETYPAKYADIRVILDCTEFFHV